MVAVFQVKYEETFGFNALLASLPADVEGMIGAGRYEPSGERSTWRNSYRDRTLDTRLG